MHATFIMVRGVVTEISGQTIKPAVEVIVGRLELIVGIKASVMIISHISRYVETGYHR